MRWAFPAAGAGAGLHPGRFLPRGTNFTNRFFMNLPPPTGTPQDSRDLLLTEQGLLHDAHATRSKRFLRSGDSASTAL